MLMGDSADKHSKEIEASEGKMAEPHAALESCADNAHHMSLNMRLGYVEVLLGNLIDTHFKEIEAAERKWLFFTLHSNPVLIRTVI